MIRILIVDDHEIVRWAMSSIVRNHLPDSDIHLAPTFEHALDHLGKHQADLVVLDIDIPGGNSPKMIGFIRQLQPASRILVHTALKEEDLSIKYLGAGADGFLSKSAPLETIQDALTTVLRGAKYISNETQRRITEYFLSQATGDPRYRKGHVLLTAREMEIVHLMLKGKWTKEIANHLGLQIATVSTHKGRIFNKFGVDNLIDLYKAVQREMPELLLSQPT